MIDIQEGHRPHRQSERCSQGCQVAGPFNLQEVCLLVLFWLQKRYIKQVLASLAKRECFATDVEMWIMFRLSVPF